MIQEKNFNHVQIQLGKWEQEHKKDNHSSQSQKNPIFPMNGFVKDYENQLKTKFHFDHSDHQVLCVV